MVLLWRRNSPPVPEYMDGPTLRQQRSKLTPLDAADFKMVRTHAENGSRRRSAQFWDVASIPIKDRPSDTRGCGPPRNLRQSGARLQAQDNTIRRSFSSAWIAFRICVLCVNGVVIA